MSILVVEDSRTQAEYLRHILETEGYDVTLAADGTEAIRRMEVDMPDIVLTDIMMPGMDGYEFVRAIRDGRTGAEHVPAIAFTAHARDEDRRLALPSGFRMQVAKPLEPTVLVRALATVLEG